MVKILLINPYFQKKYFSPLPDRIERARGRYPPIGLAYLAATLLKNNYEVRIFDANVEKSGIFGLKSYLIKFRPEIVGITTTSFTFLQAQIAAKITRQILPESNILVGGPHVSIYPTEILNNKEFDIAVIGEGEYTILDLVDAIKDKANIKNIKGILYRKDGKIYQNEFRPLIDNLDALPFPARNLLANQSYFYPFGKNNPFTTVITSRGCPYNCIFCLRASGIHFGRKYRTRSPSNICNELEQIRFGYNIKEVFFYDDVFTLNQKRIFNMCREIITRKIDISWNCRTRVDVVSQKLLAIMKQAGCERIHYGIESGDPRILRNLRKNITPAQIKKAFSWTKRNEIEAFAYVMLGGPGEDSNSIRRTMQVVKAINPEYVGFFITTLFPGTDLYKYALENELISQDVWKEFTLGTIRTQPLPYLEEFYSAQELERILKSCYREYYFRPAYIWEKLKSLKSLSQFVMNLRGFQLLLRL